MKTSLFVLGLFLAATACGGGGGDDSSSPDGGPTNDASVDHYVAGDSGNNKDSSTIKDGTTSDVTFTCGTCPTGYTCGTANGLAVCRSNTTKIPLFTNVYVILMENTSLSTLQSAITGGTAPNLKSWQASYATSTTYHGVAHPSLPNYIALTSGSTQGIGCDCSAAIGGSACNGFTCNLLVGLCSCDTSASHLGDQLEAASKTWMDFGEAMGTPCNLTDSGNYAQRHNPFLYYDNVQSNSARCTAHVVDFSNFSTASPAVFNFIAPNLIDDMHNPDPTNSTNIPDGDMWLGKQVPGILSSSAYKAGGLLVIVWDEDDGSGGITGTDDPIGIWVFSPFAKNGGYASSASCTAGDGGATNCNHYALLATFEDGLGLARLGNAANISPLTDFFPAN